MFKILKPTVDEKLLTVFVLFSSIFFLFKKFFRKSCWITLIIGMMSHQMSNVSFRVGDFNSFEESWSSPPENWKKKLFHSEEIEILWNYKNNNYEKWITVIRVRLQHHLHSVHHQHQAEFNTFFDDVIWKILRQFIMRFEQFASKRIAYFYDK